MSSFFFGFPDPSLFLETLTAQQKETLLPSNATPAELAIEATVARLGDVDVEVGSMWNPDTCPAELLPWLAWALSVDEWRAEWTENVKRDVIAAAIPSHVRKGTVWALRHALEAAGYTLAIVEEWFEVGGNPYTCVVNINLYADGLGAEDWERLASLILAYKNVRTHVELRVYQIQIGFLNLAAAGVIGEAITIYPLAPHPPYLY